MILIVEDNLDSQDVITRILRHYRIPCDTVSSAEEALHRLETTAYQGAVIDLALPDMDGWTLQQHLGSLPCIAVTAYHSAELAVKAVRAGFVAYFPKPLEANAFASAVQRLHNA